jgi:hypothetical protein
MALLLVCASSQAQTARQQANALLQRARALMQREQYDSSRVLLARARSLYPDSYVYDYELAYSYMLQKDYAQARVYAPRMLAYKDSDDGSYQFVGDLYDYNGAFDQAMATYAQGLKKYPKSGRLYTGRGIAQGRQGNWDEAIGEYENSIRAQPEYAGAYFCATPILVDIEPFGADIQKPGDFYATPILVDSEPQRLHGLLYGELFMNLERNTRRTESMSLTLYQGWNKAITVDRASLTMRVSLSGNPLDIPHKELENMKMKSVLPFTFQFALALARGTDVSLLLTGPDDQLSIANLLMLRAGFLQLWDEKSQKAYPNVLISYWQQLERAGHLEAYHYWLFSQARPQEFEAWLLGHYAEYEDFFNWFNQYPLVLSPKAYYVRGYYEH